MNIVNVGYDSTNYYVLADARPLLLVDVGWPGTLPKLQHHCTRKGIRLAEIPYLLVTHYHPDHAGLVNDLQRFGITLIVLETQLTTIPTLRTYMKPIHPYHEIDVGAARQIQCADSHAFLAQMDMRGEIISTPGHSDDSVTLVLDNGAAFTGDLTPAFIAGDDTMDPTYQSWQAIRAVGGRTIYPGHGPTWPLHIASS